MPDKPKDTLLLKRSGEKYEIETYHEIKPLDPDKLESRWPPHFATFKIEADGYEFTVTGVVTMTEVSSGKELSKEEVGEYFNR
jgi:hypothetical protein